MFKRIGRWLHHIDGWFFRLTDKQRVGVVLATALFLFSAALYCLGIGSVILLQRPYEVNAAVVSTSEPETEELEILEPVSMPTPLPTPTPVSGASFATPIAAVEIIEPPAVPRPSLSEPPARPRVVGPETKPEAPSQRLPNAVATKPSFVVQPTAIPKPNLTNGTPVTTAQPTRPGGNLPTPGATAASKQPPIAPTTTGAQPTAASKQPTVGPTAVPKPAQPQQQPTAASKTAPTATSR